MRYLISLAIFVALSATSVANAVDTGCVNYRDYIHRVGGLELPEPAHSSAVAGGYAYVADGASGVQVVDVSQPANPQIVTRTATPGPAYDIAIQGSYAYVVDDLGLRIVSIADPTSPQMVGSLDIPGNTRWLAVAGSYAYVSSWLSGLYVLEISDPTDPQILSVEEMMGRDIVISGQFVFVAASDDGLMVVDVADPLDPHVIGSLELPVSGWLGFPYSAKSLAVEGDRAIIVSEEADRFSGRLFTVDVTDPASPQLLGEGWLRGVPGRVELSAGVAYVVSTRWDRVPARMSYLETYDLTDAAVPIVIGTVEVPIHSEQVTLAGSHAYVAGPEFHIIDVSNPGGVQIIGSASQPDYVLAIAETGNLALVARAYALDIFDVTDPTAPQVLSRLDTPNYLVNVTGTSTHAFLSEQLGVRIVDITDPANPQIVTLYETPGTVSETLVDDNLAYVVGGGFGLHVLDVTNPADPVLVGAELTAGYADIALTGDLLIADYQGGIAVIDVSDPTNPHLIGTAVYYLGGNDLAAVGSFVYVCGYGGVESFDISEPTTPQPLERWFTGDQAWGIVADNQFAYVNVWNSGVQVIDITNPADLMAVAYVPYGATSEALALGETHLYVDHRDVLIIPAQCTDGPVPTMVKLFEAEVTSDGVHLALQLAENTFDVAATLLRGTSPDLDQALIHSAASVHLDGDIIKYLDRTVQPGMNYWYWAEIKEAGRTVLYAGPVSVVVPTIGGGATFVFPVFPNPTPNAATIRYTLGTEDTGGGQASVSLAIYDLRGRLVRILVRAEQPAGIHTVEWDGRADDGTRLSPGVYYYRFRGGAHAQQSRIVLLR